MTGDKEVAEFVADKEAMESVELRFVNKGMRAVYGNAAQRNIERAAAPETKIRKAIERSDARREIPMTLPKLSYLEDGE